MIANCINTNAQVMDHLESSVKSYHRRTPTMGRFYPQQISQGEYSDILDSIRISLDKMLPEKKYPRRSSRGSTQDSNSSFEDEEETQESQVNPNIQTLLNSLDACILKLDTSLPNENLKQGEEIPKKPQTAAQNLESSHSPEDKGFFNSTFGRRRSNFVLPTRDRQGSLASVATASTLNSASGSSPRSSSLANTSLTHFTVSEVSNGATLKGYLTKLFVTNPSFLARKSWKKRYFVLNGTSLFRFKADADNTTCSEVFHLTSTCSVCVNESFPGKKFVLQITESQGNNMVYLLADNSEDLSHWLGSIKEAIARARFQNQTLPPSPEGCEFPSRFDSRRSSSQTLPISFEIDTESFAIHPNRISRANSQPVVQTFPSLSNNGTYSNTQSPVQSQKYISGIPSSNSSPIFGKVSTASRIRNGVNPRIPPLNVSRRPSLAPLRENDSDDSEFLKEVLEPISTTSEVNGRRANALLSLFSNDASS